MRALAHPVRIALLEAITREGPLTATEASELLGESPANCSFHLRTLAKYGFVEEAEGGTGRSRPWRRVSAGHRWETVHDDAETSIAAHTLSDLAHQRLFETFREWSAGEGSFSREWQTAAFTSSTIAYLTADELNELGEEFLAILRRYQDRTLDRSKRPAGSAPVSLVTIGHPLPPTPSGS